MLAHDGQTQWTWIALGKGNSTRSKGFKIYVPFLASVVMVERNLNPLQNRNVAVKCFEENEMVLWEQFGQAGEWLEGAFWGWLSQGSL